MKAGPFSKIGLGLRQICMNLILKEAYFKCEKTAQSSPNTPNLKPSVKMTFYILGS